MFKKIASTTVIVAALSSASMVSTTTPAAAMSDGAAAAIGLGAFAVGAIASSGGMGGGYGYAAPRVVYHDCYMSRRPVYNGWGDMVGFRQTRVCN